jgi:hypothetical protein
MPPDKKINKAEVLLYLFIYIANKLEGVFLQDLSSLVCCFAGRAKNLPKSGASKALVKLANNKLDRKVSCKGQGVLIVRKN